MSLRGSECFCHDVAIPRKGSCRLKLFVAMAKQARQSIAILNVTIYKIPPQRRYPDRPPLMVKDVLCWYVVLCDGRKKNMIVQFICWTAKLLMIKTTSFSIYNKKTHLETQNQGAFFYFYLVIKTKLLLIEIEFWFIKLKSVFAIRCKKKVDTY